jgi:sugar lactone lactonase YvrE
VQGSGDGQFNLPCAVAVDAGGNVYVADRANNTIQKFSAEGAFLTKWGSQCCGNGSLSGPWGVAVDADANVYVADLGNARIQKFTNNGTYITQWGTFGSGNGQFEYPLGIAVDASGNVYVADESDRVQKFAGDGTFIATFGAQGSGDGQFGLAYGVAVDAIGNVYVVDNGHHRVEKFSATGSYLTQWGTPGSGDGQFNYPTGVAVDAHGNIYVADTSNNRIQVFGPAGLDVVTSVMGRGFVTRSPNFAQCPPGTSLTLTAVPLPGARFVGWTGDTTIAMDSFTVTVWRALSYLATFERDPATAPHLVAVTDTPGDQGSFVTVRWQPSPIDTGSVPGFLCCYEIQRRNLSPAVTPWAVVDTVGATSLAGYTHNVSTPADSTLLDPAVFGYRVIALANADTSQWVSNEVNGYSVDNLAPPAPVTVGGSIASGFANLVWSGVSATDLSGYHIFRGPTQSVPTDAAHLVGTTTTPTFNDSPGFFAYYRVTAFDIHGNDSPGTLFVPFNPAGVPDRPAPKVLSIGDPSPSPMQRTMSMTLGLPHVMGATVDVLDSQGRLVRRLCAGEQPAGWLRLSWDARDAKGRQSAAAMYFVRVQTKEGRSVKRIVLLP